MKRIQLLRPVKIDGVDYEPGTHSIEDGNADSLLNAGWARKAAGKAESDESPASDDDVPSAPIGADDDKPVETPAPKRAPRKR